MNQTFLVRVSKPGCRLTNVFCRISPGQRAFEIHQFEKIAPMEQFHGHKMHAVLTVRSRVNIPDVDDVWMPQSLCDLRFSLESCQKRHVAGARQR